MELKFTNGGNLTASTVSSNRTFMELKFYIWNAIMNDIKGSNRTFMELKFVEDGKVAANINVLIVPLWN